MIIKVVFILSIKYSNYHEKKIWGKDIQVMSKSFAKPDKLLNMKETIAPYSLDEPNRTRTTNFADYTTHF